MGNFCSKSNRIDPMPSAPAYRKRKRTIRERLLCIDNRVLPIVAENTNRIKSASVSSDNNAVSSSGIRSASPEPNTPSLHSSATCEPPTHLNSLPCERAPLPSIGDTEGGYLIHRRRKEDQLGVLRSVAFDVNFVKRPKSGYLIRNPPTMPRRLNRLPDTTLERIETKLSDAAQRKETLMRCRSAKLNQRLLSREMIERLEAEKQREIRLRTEEKQQQAQARKDRLVQERQERLQVLVARQQRTRQTSEEHTRAASSAVQEHSALKQQAANQRKEAIKEKAGRRKRIARLRQLKAKLNVLEKNEAREDDMVSENKDSGNLPCGSKLDNVQRRMAFFHEISDENESNEDLCKLETFESSGEDSELDFGSEKDSEDEDDFWKLP